RSPIDARAKTTDSPETNIRTCGQIRGSEHDHRRLNASPLPLPDQRTEGPHGQSLRKDAELRLRALTGDIRAECGSSLSADRRRWRGGTRISIRSIRATGRGASVLAHPTRRMKSHAGSDRG